jgi:hypothetical protein
MGLGDDAFDFMDVDKLEQQLEALRQQHRDLDERIRDLEADAGPAFQIMGLKREKLRVKDRIVWISAKLTPDIIA